MCKMPGNNPISSACTELSPDWLLFPVARVILESDPQQVLQKVNYRVRFLPFTPKKNNYVNINHIIVL